jgi:hypothetical protein
VIPGCRRSFSAFWRAAHHSVVFDSPETLVVRKFDLINEIFAGAIFEHAIVDGITKVERRCGVWADDVCALRAGICLPVRILR